VILALKSGQTLLILSNAYEDIGFTFGSAHGLARVKPRPNRHYGATRPWSVQCWIWNGGNRWYL